MGRIKPYHFIISIVVIFIGVLITAVFLLQSPTWWSKTIKTVINQQPKEQVYCREVLIDKVNLNYMKGEIGFHAFQMKIKVKEKDFFISFDEAAIHNLYSLITKDGFVSLMINKGAVIGKDLSMTGVYIDSQFNIKNHILDKYQADLKIASIDLSKIHFNNFSSKIKGDFSNIKFSTAVFDFIEGKITLDMLIDLVGNNTFSINAIIEGIDLKLLSASYPEIVDKVEGLISGRFQLTVENSNIIGFRESFAAMNGAMIQASLLRNLFQYVPQYKQIQDLILLEKKVLFEKAKIETVSMNGEKFSSQIALFSSKLNLDTNIVADINLEGGLKGVLEQAGLLGGFNEFYLLIKLFNFDYRLYR